MREVFRTENAVEAALLKSYLDGAGIDYFVTEDSTGGSIWGGVTCYSFKVLETDIAAVKLLLNAGDFLKGHNNLEVIETTLLNGRVQLLQPKTGFHASVDAVFLAAAVPIKERAHVLDVGCGVGSVGLCVLARTREMRLTGIDIQPELVDLAQQNAALNDIEALCRFVHGDIRTEKEIVDNAFSYVVMNPPYQEGGTHTASPVKNKALSHGEEASGASLEDWIKYAHRKLKSGGTLVLIHRADRMSEVVAVLEKKRWFGSLVIYPLYSHAGEDAKRVIIRARKERYAPMALKAGLVIHEKDGTYTNGAQKILSAAEAIDMD